MVDVKYWGPSGWKLLHTLSFQDNVEKKVFSVLGDVLPCKYCRKSTKQFIRESSVTDDIPVWLYNLHNNVNRKLEMQHAEDPTVPMPAPAPSFEEVKSKYNHPVGPLIQYKEFLYSMAFNFDRKKHVVSSHKIFWTALSATVPRMTNNKTYLSDVKKILNDPSDVYSEVLKHKSVCKRKTCRKSHLRKRTLRSS